jgi:hypothetical protein
MTNYDQLKTRYLSNSKNRKLYEIEMTKLELIETIERLTKATSETEREQLFLAIDQNVLTIKEKCHTAFGCHCQ